MAIIPILFDNWWDTCADNSPRISRIISKPIDYAPFPSGFLLTINDEPRRCSRKNCKRPAQSDKIINKQQVPTKTASADFHIDVDVHQFKPEELSVKATDTYIIVEGKREEKDVENGYELEHFVRRYQLPAQHDSGKITSSLSSDGVLTISAPKKADALPEPEKTRTIAIQQPEKPGNSNHSEKKNENVKSYTLEDLNE